MFSKFFIIKTVFNDRIISHLEKLGLELLKNTT